MALSHSSSIATGGLVFYYDAGNTQKSWKGRPVTNNFVLPTVDVNGFNVQNDTFTRVRSGNYGGYDITGNDYVWRFDFTASSTCPYHGNDTTVIAGVTYTFSFDYYVSPDAPAGGYGTRNLTLAAFEQAISGSVSDTTPAVVGVWKRAVFTGTTGSTNLRALLYPGGCFTAGMSSSGFILFKNPQVEASAPGNNPSPFVAGTRSDTQAIVDLTNNNTVTANSLTYASNGTFSFNGSSNFLTCGNNSAISAISGTTAVSVEAWVNLSGYGSSSYGVITHKGNPWAWLMENPSNRMQIRFGLSVSGDVACADSATHALNTWYQFVGTYDGANMRFYRNGVLTNTVAASGTLGGTGINMVVGNFSGAYYSQGQIPVVKIYNKTLTAAEVQQNFNALRGRYGI
jgi:hypothetical protein